MTIVCFNGRYLDEKDASLSIHDTGFLFGEGIYESLRTIDGKAFNMEGHLVRFKHSADLVGIPLPSLRKLGKWIQGVLDQNGPWSKKREGRVRITVSGGIHGYCEPIKKPTILITVSPLKEVPKRKRMRGVSAITYKVERPIPGSKTTNLIPSILARREMKKQRAYEVFFVDHDGYVTEGSVSNIFIVKKGQLITPKSSLLPGTTRERILGMARKHKWKIALRDFKAREVYVADEVFFTNAPRGIVPITKLDGKKIGGGSVGPITKEVWEALKA